MDCEAATERMLSAEPSELRGEGSGPLSSHLETCPACSAAALRILDATRRLARDREPGGPPPRVRIPGGRFPRRRRWGVAAALVAAGTAAVLLLPRSARQGGPPPPAPGIASAPEAGGGDGAADGVGVSVPEGSNAIVFQTTNPLITVVWYY